MGDTAFLKVFRRAMPIRRAQDPLFESQNNIKTLGLFLDNGSSVDELDHNFGATCLHDFLGSQDSPPLKEDWHDSLKFLIAKGADVFAEDDEGRSVSHAAYSPNCRDPDSSYRGDLWDAVLDACDFDIQHFRKGYPRTARYTWPYTRSDFEALWKGREERCPYWNDTYWHSRLDDANSDDNSELTCYCGDECHFQSESDSDSDDELADEDPDIWWQLHGDEDSESEDWEQESEDESEESGRSWG